MAQHKIHFSFDDAKKVDAEFAAALIEKLGQADLESADKIVAIGGDGALLHALHGAADKTIMGVVPPQSSSIGFWTNRGIESADQLLTALAAPAYPIMPLQAGITFADGSSTTRYGYNDISIRSVHREATPELRARFKLSAIDVCIQSLLLALRISFANAAIGPVPVMGTGLIFATPFGSTAMNRNYGGPSLDIRSDGIVLTGIGISQPTKGFPPIYNEADTAFHLDVQSQDKRPALLTFDSFGVLNNERSSPIRNVKIAMAQTRAVNLVLTDDPGRRAYAAMMG